MKKLKVKFCGMKDEDTIEYALELGADYLGFIVDYPQSPRNNSFNEFCKKAERLRKTNSGKYKIVAVCVDMPTSNIENLIKDDLAQIIQLHGKENISVCRRVKKRTETWKAVSGKNNLGSEVILGIASVVDKILVDSGTAEEKASGKSGFYNNHELYNLLVQRGISTILSGGINANNVKFYLKNFNPSIIDISSGIESSPGVKSRKKMKEFMDMAVYLNRD